MSGLMPVFWLVSIVVFTGLGYVVGLVLGREGGWRLTRRTALAAVASIAVFFAGFGVAKALANADTFNIVSANSYSGAVEAGDLLLVIHYDINYNSCCPAETANEAFLGSYFDLSGSLVLRSSAPFVEVNSGYGQGVMSAYFTASDVTDFGIACADGDFARITGNPAVFPSPQTLDKLITCGASSDPATQIATDIRAIANLLEQRTEWAGVSLISGTLLQTSGEAYFDSAIPNLRTIAPALFQGSFETPDFIEDDPGTSYRSTLQDFFDGSAFATVFDGTASWVNLSVMMTKFIFWMGLTFAAAAFVMAKTQQGVTGFPVFGVLIPTGVLMGMIDLQFAALIGSLGVVVIVWVLFLKRATE